MMTRAPEICSQVTGMPSQGSAEPQRPTPINRYGRPAAGRGGVELVARLAHVVAAGEVERPERALRVGEHVANRRELHEVARVARTEPQAVALGHDGAAEPERDRGDAVARGQRRR